MSNGGTRLVFNTRERIISSDHNRLQDFEEQDKAELLARLYNDQVSMDEPGEAFMFTGIPGGDTPLRADVYGGLFVEVDDPSSLTISKGTLGCVIQDATVGMDDSDYKIIRSPGLQTLGVLTFTANTSGSRRIDVIECQPNETILESDNRDVFDPATGLFTPQLFSKVVARQLNFRIRNGVGGSGYPGGAQGWLPLAIASVPDGAAGWNECTFWDVRPLVRERYQEGLRPGLAHPNLKTEAVCDVISSPTLGSDVLAFRGFALSTFNEYLAGGKITKSTPETSSGFETFVNGDVDHVAVLDPDNNTTVPTDPAQYWLHLVALFPHGLPRWARYSNNGPNRAPFGARGILVIRKSDLDGTIGVGRRAGLGAIPASTGLTGLSAGVILASTWGDVDVAGSVGETALINGNEIVPHSAFNLTITPAFDVVQDAWYIDIDALVASGAIPRFTKGLDLLVRWVNDRTSAGVQSVEGFATIVSNDLQPDQWSEALHQGPSSVQMYNFSDNDQFTAEAYGKLLLPIAHLSIQTNNLRVLFVAQGSNLASTASVVVTLRRIYF